MQTEPINKITNENKYKALLSDFWKKKKNIRVTFIINGSLVQFYSAMYN